MSPHRLVYRPGGALRGGSSAKTPLAPSARRSSLVAPLTPSARRGFSVAPFAPIGRRAAALAALAALLAPPPAFAQDKQTCAAAHEEAQLLRQRGSLKGAREKLKTCSRSACPALVRNDCVTWLDQVERSMSSIVVEAQKGGADVIDVRVYFDGLLVAPRLNGKAIEVEPGEHLMRFETTGAKPLQRQVVIREGEKSRLVSVRFDDGAPPKPPPPPVIERPVPAGVYVFGALGVVGLGGFVGFGLSGRSAERDLRSRCAPNCDPDEVDAARNKFVLANASLSVGAVSLIGATVWYLLRPSEEVAPPSAKASSLSVVPLDRGSALLWQGRF